MPVRVRIQTHDRCSNSSKPGHTHQGLGVKKHSFDAYSDTEG